MRDVGEAAFDEASGKRGGGQTVGGRFTAQLRDLVGTLDATGLHFVRCIKPNADLKPSLFDARMVLHQLRCCGVLEVARIARAGFPTRYTHAAFVERYHVLLPPELRATLGLAGLGGAGARRDAVLRLLAAFKVEAGSYQVGRSKVFFRPGVLGYVEDTWARMQRSAVVVQAAARAMVARRAFLRVRQAAAVIQSGFRAIEVRAFALLAGGREGGAAARCPLQAHTVGSAHSSLCRPPHPAPRSRAPPLASC